MKRLDVVKLIFFILVSVVLASCAGAPLSQNVSKDLRASKIAVAYFQKEKKINYKELVYKVFWNETRKHDVSFDGLWDVDSELSNYMAPRVSKLGLNATSVYELLPSDDIDKLHKDMISTIAVENKKSVKKDLVLSDSLRNALIAKQIDYLIAVDSNYIYIYTQIGVKQGSALAGLTLLDVKSNEQKYFGGFPVGGTFHVEESARELEDNNLEGLKNALKAWLESAISNSMPKQLGLSES